ncbi:MAG: sugar transferase, partial [Chitinispirillaceae bacterium]|nr:sugar transferase [Chitinispirillaceae bacterium]
MAKFLEKILTLCFDFIAINIAYFAAFWLRYKSNIFPETYNPEIALITHLAPSFYISIAWIILFFFTGLYRDWYKESRLDEMLVVSRTVIIGIFLLFLVTSSDQIIEFFNTLNPKVLFTKTKFTILATYTICMLFFSVLNRVITHSFKVMLFSKGIGISKILIVGANEEGINVAKEVSNFPQLGYRVAGFIDDDGRKKGKEYGEFKVLGTYSDIPFVVRKEKINGLIITRVSASANEIQRILEYCGDIKIDIYLVPSLIDVISGHFKTHQIFGVPLMVLLKDHMPAWEAQIKRLMDITVSLVVLLLGLPIWIIIAILIKATSKGPVIYKQERVGKNGKIFTMYKFRSMYEDAEKRTGPVWAQKEDPRITPIGKFIRKTRIDEIPQFINVLKGEMSLVGPRPERPFFVEQLKKEIPWYVR